MPADISPEYWVTLALWVLTPVVLLFQAWRLRQPVVGLALAFWAALAMIHLLGGVIQLLPWHDDPNRASTLRGFPLTGYALCGFLVGNLVFQWYRPASWRRPLRVASLPPEAVPTTRYVIGVALLTFFLLGSLVSLLPRGA